MESAELSFRLSTLALPGTPHLGLCFMGPSRADTTAFLATCHALGVLQQDARGDWAHVTVSDKNIALSLTGAEGNLNLDLRDLDDEALRAVQNASTTGCVMVFFGFIDALGRSDLVDVSLNHAVVGSIEIDNVVHATSGCDGSTELLNAVLVDYGTTPQ